MTYDPEKIVPRAPRVKISLPLRLDVADTEIFIETTAANLSQSGMFVATPVPLDAGTRVHVAAVFENGQRLFDAEAEVVRRHVGRDGTGLGLRFIDLPVEAGQLIDRIVKDEARFGQFQLEALIGRGGMAEVYRARMLAGPHLGEPVALKRLLPELASDPVYVDLFISEADITGTLNHPTIVKVIETGRVADTFYMALEYVDGGNLRHLLHVCRIKKKNIPILVACYIAQNVAEALAYVHQAKAPNGTLLGVVHCDIAPSNIFVAYDGSVRLGDFGVAQASLRSQNKSTVLVGRAPYRAPEQILGRPVSSATDVFALGAVLYELLTLREAFVGPDSQAIHQKILSGTLVPPSTYRSEIPLELEQIVMRALGVRPKGQNWWATWRSKISRIGDARILAHELGQFVGSNQAGREALVTFIRELTS